MNSNEMLNKENSLKFVIKLCFNHEYDNVFIMNMHEYDIVFNHEYVLL